MKNTLLHLQYKHSGMLANRTHEELSDPKSENVRPHYSQSSRANATPSSGTSPLAPYKEGLPGLPQSCSLWEGLKPETLVE